MSWSRLPDCVRQEGSTPCMRMMTMIMMMMITVIMMMVLTEGIVRFLYRAEFRCSEDCVHNICNMLLMMMIVLANLIYEVV